jgi:glyoxylase-like metal-dependent hydrolase (beta-lactamase superfamily II)
MQWTIGDVRVTKVVEHELPIPLNGLLTDVPEGAADRHGWLKPDFLDDAGLARLSIHGLVIDTGERRILVDTCVGNLREGLVFPPAESTFIDALAAAGYAIEDIDTVVCTHLHFDHVGWNTRLEGGKWVVTFTNARYLIGRVEWEHWSSTDGDYSNVGETVRPVVEAGAADLVEVDHQICPEVRLVPTPGHTPGHVSVVIESGGQRAVITGDMAHHPLQFAEPDIGAPADSDSPMAAKTRRVFLAEREQDSALVIGTHFGGPTAGRIVADGETWRLTAEPGR